MSYYVVHDWMVKELKLKTIEKDVFAVIYGFNQNKNAGAFHGSLQYLEDMLGIDRSNICRALARLVEKKYLIKEDIRNGGIKYCKYIVNHELIYNCQNNNECCQNDNGNSKKCCQNDNQGVVKMTNNNISNNIVKDNNINNKDIAVDKSTALNNSNDLDTGKSEYLDLHISKTINTIKANSEKNPPVASAPPKEKSDYTKVVDLWFNCYKDFTGLDYDFTARDGKHIKDLLKKLDYGELNRRFDNYFNYAKDNKFVRDNISISNFVSNFQKPFCVGVIDKKKDNIINGFKIKIGLD